MAVVWKFPLYGYDPIEMPHGAKVLSAGVQNDDVVVWALCDPSADLVKHRIQRAPTGGDFSSENVGEFIGTVTTSYGFVWHVFDGGEV